MPFKSGFRPTKEVSGEALWFLFHDQRLMMKEENGNLMVPGSSDLEGIGLDPLERQYLGSRDNRPCFAGEVAAVPGGGRDVFAFHNLRKLFGCVEEEVVWIAGLANQLVQWRRNHHICGRCGRPMQEKTDERARLCPGCGLINYPRLSPAVIVAVTKGDRILLANSRRFPSRFYSVLAGFVEPGETLEGCVRREVQEEVGLFVKRIRYFGSQPWPFPDSLMIGFTAEYEHGEITADPSEILDADWFPADDLPPVPPKISIARRLIDWFIDAHGKKA